MVDKTQSGLTATHSADIEEEILLREDGLSIDSFRPLYLTVENIGPFRGKRETIDFTDKEGAPCNFFLFASENGRGKTTLLEVMALLMSFMEDVSRIKLDKKDSKLINGGYAQWDILIGFTKDDRKDTIVLSISVGPIGTVNIQKEWSNEELNKFSASSWSELNIGYAAQQNRLIRSKGKKKSRELFEKSFNNQISDELNEADCIDEEDKFVDDLLFSIMLQKNKPHLDFQNNPETLPTILLFSAYRNIDPIDENERRPLEKPEEYGYSTLHRFGNQGGRWINSIDNFLVWFKWINEDLFTKTIKIINDRVFAGQPKQIEGVRKQQLEIIVNNSGSLHTLDQLSSGEKNLVQLFLQIGAHMTKNTILLIDEVETHLHLKFQNRVIMALKELIKDNPGFTVIATTHSLEVLRTFAYEIKEEGLRKGGLIIEQELKHG